LYQCFNPKRKITLLKSGNIFLREMSFQDINDIFKWENNSENWKYSDTKTPFTKEEIQDFINAKQNLVSDGQMRLMICLNNNTPIGCIDLFEFDKKNKSAGVGILIGEEQFRKKGYALDSLQILINYSKKKLKLKKLFCNISPKNTISIRLFEKSQFLFIRKKMLFGNSVNYYELGL